MHSRGEKFKLNSICNEFPTTAIQSATDSFGMGKTINQLRRLCVPSTESLSTVERSEPTYSSINLLNTNEHKDPLDEIPDDADAITHDDEDNLLCEINLNADN